MILNCITIDDEPLALELINSFVQQTGFLRLIGSYQKASLGLQAILTENVDIVFMDIHMPGSSGIELAQALKKSKTASPPKIIFTTAFNQYAYESYQVNALDYLLKPFEYEEFLKAALKAKTNLSPKALNDSSDDYEALIVKSGYKQVRVAIPDIKYIQGLKDYAAIHLKTPGLKPIITLSTQKSLLAKLPPEKFMRIQRSFIAAMDVISSFSLSSIWIGDLEIKIGEKYKQSVQEQLSKNN